MADCCNNKNNDKKEITILENFGCGCSTIKIEDKKHATPHWITGSIESTIGTIQQVSTELTKRDTWNEIKSRISNFRNNYAVEPGIYGVGNPTDTSDIFISANYKMSFDKLRSALKNINAWILVLDTKGINVWCAAGKGTFGTDELIKKITDTKIESLVIHRKIVLPQLGAPGVDAKTIQKITGFKVLFGPVKAEDINDYLKNNYKCTDEMRRIQFPILDRAVLTPMEFIPAFKWFPLIALGIFLYFSINGSGLSISRFLNEGIYFIILTIAAIIAGAILGPIMLPVLPTRSFAIKGFVIGGAITAFFLESGFFPLFHSYTYYTAYLLFPALSSFLLLQFTGSTTYTGISGVRKELKYTTPLYSIMILCAIILLGIHKFNGWSI